MFQSIHMVTYSATNFDASVQALSLHLGYQRIESGKISEDLARAWGTPAAKGCRYSVLQAASKAEFFIRFIESTLTPGYRALKTIGWNATELLVQDVHALALSLQNSAYEIIGGPRDLLEDGTAIALQVRGPSDEIFYLTELNGDAFQGKYGIANSAVDRAFIAVLGSKLHGETLEFYRPLCTLVTEPSRLGIRVLANAHDLDPLLTKFDIASAALAKQFRIEVDGYPESATARPILAGHLPPGMCLVSIITDSIAELGLGTEEDASNGSFHNGYEQYRMRVLSGINEEMIELLEPG